MSSVLFQNTERHAHPKLALSSVLIEYANSIDFRVSHDPDRCAADDVTLGKCLKTFTTFNEKSETEGNKIVQNHYPNTNVADYINLGKDGYLRIEAKVLKNRKRGTSYLVVVKRPHSFNSFRTLERFSSKEDAVKYAKAYAVAHLDEQVCIQNHKGEQVGHVYFDIKHYPKKPSLTKKEGRVVVPAYQYLFIGKAYVG